VLFALLRFFNITHTFEHRRTFKSRTYLKHGLINAPPSIVSKLLAQQRSYLRHTVSSTNLLQTHNTVNMKLLSISTRFLYILTVLDGTFVSSRDLAKKPLPSLRPSLNGNLASERPPAKKPLPHPKPNAGTNPDNGEVYRKSCGISLPTQVSWDNGKKEEVGEWVDKHWDLYLRGDQYKSFPLYLRDNFAPDLAPSSVNCDGIGSCTVSYHYLCWYLTVQCANFIQLGTCLSLDKTLSLHDREMAYCTFESISSIEHLHKSMEKATAEATLYYQGKINSMVGEFTSAKRIERRRLERKKQEEVLNAAFTAVALLGTALLSGVIPELGQGGILAGSLVKVGLRPINGAVGRTVRINSAATLMSNSYIGIAGLATKARDNP
jgi:hypothetical protein